MVDEHECNGKASATVWKCVVQRCRMDPIAVQCGPVQTHAAAIVLRFDRDGKITYNRDHFDAADGFYAALPVVGTLLRQIKKRL